MKLVKLYTKINGTSKYQVSSEYLEEFDDLPMDEQNFYLKWQIEAGLKHLFEATKNERYKQALELLYE